MFTFALTGFFGVRFLWNAIGAVDQPTGEEADAFDERASSLEMGSPAADQAARGSGSESLDVEEDNAPVGDDLSPAADQAGSGGETAPGRRASPLLQRRRLLGAWFALYAFVGTQMAWILRPFFGAPGQAFVIFRGTEGTFYEAVFKVIVHLLTSW